MKTVKFNIDTNTALYVEEGINLVLVDRQGNVVSEVTSEHTQKRTSEHFNLCQFFGKLSFKEEDVPADTHAALKYLFNIQSDISKNRYRLSMLLQEEGKSIPEWMIDVANNVNKSVVDYALNRKDLQPYVMNRTVSFKSKLDKENDKATSHYEVDERVKDIDWIQADSESGQGFWYCNDSKIDEVVGILNSYDDVEFSYISDNRDMVSILPPQEK